MSFNIPNTDAGIKSPQPVHVSLSSGPKPQSLGHGNACATCRLRKVRCDAARPICTPCTNSRRECNYVGAKKAPGPASTAALAARYAELQERYAELSHYKPGASAQLTESNSAGDDQSSSSLHSIPNVHANPQGNSYLAGPTEISEMDRDIMLEVFFHEQCRGLFYQTREDFFRSLKHPSEPQRPHPALIDIMVLLGSVFIKLPAHETRNTATLLGRIPQPETLVARIHTNISDSLARLDRLKDAFSATTLLCNWLFYQGRFQEAQYLCSSMARVIIGAKLHQIDRSLLEGISGDLLAGSSPTPWDETLLGRPQDFREVGSRILVFWQSYFAEKLISTVTGLPTAYDDSEEARITTVWPRSLQEYDSGAAFRDGDFDSINELVSTAGDLRMLHHENRYRDTMFTMLVQATTFIDRTCRLAAAIQATPEISRYPEVHRTLRELHTAVVDMVARTPPNPTNDKPRETTDGDFKEGSFEKLYLLSRVWLSLYVSEIQICRSLEVHYRLSGESSSDMASYYHNLAVEKARGAMGYIRSACQQTMTAEAGDHSSYISSSRFTKDPYSLHAGFFLTVAGITLGGELHELENLLQVQVEPHSRTTLQARFDDLQSDFLDIHEFIESRAHGYPILDFQLAKLDKVRLGLSV